ncbi:MAG: hypothetical protein ACLUUO_16055 [Sellimonas intestinalis]
MKKMKERLGKEGLLFLDGGMGTRFCRAGTAAGRLPEHGISESLGDHRRYTDSIIDGSDIVLANTFGANAHFTMTPGAEGHWSSQRSGNAKKAKFWRKDDSRRAAAACLGPTGSFWSRWEACH